jgi:hypothetical protein
LRWVRRPRVLLLLFSNLRCSFGEDRQTFDQFAYTWSVKPYEKDGPVGGRTPKTHVSFVFRYRTREWLQMQGIMPDSDVPLSPPVTRASMRRVSSAPAVPIHGTESTLITPRASPTPPRKKLKSSVQEKPYLAAVPASIVGPNCKPHYFLGTETAATTLCRHAKNSELSSFKSGIFRRRPKFVDFRPIERRGRG